MYNPGPSTLTVYLICYSFGFAKYEDVRDSELCIRGFYKLGYEVGFARVCRQNLSTFPRTRSNHVQESFNSRLKAEGDEQSTNLYVSNLPRNMTEAVGIPVPSNSSSTDNSCRNLVLSSWTTLFCPAEFSGMIARTAVVLALLGEWYISMLGCIATNCA
jgi:hypothetical protein